jgi:hypothetical protein
MKKLFLIIGIVTFIHVHSIGQDVKTETHYMQITTIESVISGGAGRSKMIITKDDGSAEEKELNNIFSMVGINFKNIKENEINILTTLKTYTDDGWKLANVIPLTLSPNQSGNGMFMTRYLLSREINK